MLENCEAPSEDQLKELDLIPLTDERAQKRKKEDRPTEDGNEATTEVSSDDESIVSEIELFANRWGFYDACNPLFFRFTSIAFQHVSSSQIVLLTRDPHL